MGIIFDTMNNINQGMLVFIGLILLLLFVFVIFQFITMLTSKIPLERKGIWTTFFIFGFFFGFIGAVIVAFIWWIVKPRRGKK